MSKPVLKANLSPMQTVTEALSMTVLRPGREAALIKIWGTTACLSSAVHCMQLDVMSSICLGNQPCASEVCNIWKFVAHINSVWLSLMLLMSQQSTFRRPILSAISALNSAGLHNIALYCHWHGWWSEGILIYLWPVNTLYLAA